MLKKTAVLVSLLAVLLSACDVNHHALKSAIKKGAVIGVYFPMKCGISRDTQRRIKRVFLKKGYSLVFIQPSVFGDAYPKLRENLFEKSNLRLKGSVKELFATALKSSLTSDAASLLELKKLKEASGMQILVVITAVGEKYLLEGWELDSGNLIYSHEYFKYIWFSFFWDRNDLIEKHFTEIINVMQSK